jgi:hypothetical protein
MYLFYSNGCGDLCEFRKGSNRICANEVCNSRVPEGNGMLYSTCRKKGNHLGEPEVSFDEAERAHWERMDRELHGRIERRIQIYSSQDMSREELRSFVSSRQEEAA